MTEGIVHDVVVKSQLLDSVNCDSSVERLVDGVVPDVGVSDISDHVEMNWVAAELR